MKKLIILPLLIVLLTLIVSCSGGKEKKSKKKIVGAFNDFNDTFLVYVRQDMEKYVKEKYPDYEIAFVDGRGDHATLQSALENTAIQEVDGVMINLVNPESASPIDKIFIDAKIPHLYFNRLPIGLPEDSFYYVGINEYLGGELQAKYASDIKSNATAVIIMGILGNDSVIKRSKGVTDYIKNNKLPIKIAREQTANWQREQALRLIETWLTAGTPIDIVFANNDEMALGASQALRDAGKKIGTNKGEVIVCGIDATPDAQRAIKDGTLSMSVLQDHLEQARRSVDNIIGLIEGKEVVKMDLFEPVTITKENVETIK